ncbi:type IV secretion system protein VirD4 [Luteibacter sp. Sphag1AF]|uniref:type IV secretory system conjugative DNA transfer family protein n=1 Tax=Luteibacter sp. Sphag1AF TaxID=2587031 RepID=UPI001616D789|nr:type IV secretory system conjugative DNA transfer family protein [Luteibacter sp. Sphag1AF]MBB3228661.1 type IV secretion system protein VirD4 [Luteibacter sp. Sphag1AF]
MTTFKAALALAGFALAVYVGLRAAGLLTLFLLHSTHVPWEWHTYWVYFSLRDHPAMAPHAGTIKAAGVVGFGVPLALWTGAVAKFLKPVARSAHGEARFAQRRDLSREGLLRGADTGIVIGKSRNDLLRLNGTRHALLAAPTRSGKGVGAVIPNLLTYRDSVVVLDIKQEAFDLTSGWRATQGEVFLFNPFSHDLKTHGWNPMSYVSTDRAHRTSDLQAIAAILYDDEEQRDRFWTSSARNCFLAASLYLFDRCDNERTRGKKSKHGKPTLGRIYRLLSGDGGNLKNYLASLAEQDFLSDDARTAFANLTSLSDKTLSSVVGMFQAPLHMFINPVLDKATSRDSFDLRKLREKPMSIYVGISPDKLAESRQILNLFFSQAINQNVRELPEKNASLKHQCLILLDEFTALGRVDIIARSISFLAGYNLRIFTVIQSLSQLDATYGRDVARSMVTNLACQIIYTPREQRDASDYSEMLGYTTVRKRKETRSTGSNKGMSYTEVDERRALMLPQELKAMSPDEQIIFIEGSAHPIKCRKIRYYKDRFFTERLLPKVDVPRLCA